jgi:hypothetical protein
MAEAIVTTALARAIGRDEAVVRTIAAGLPMESTVRHRVERRFTLKDAIAITIVDALGAGALPRRVAFALVTSVVDDFERIVGDEDHTPWSVLWPSPDTDLGFEFKTFSDPEDALTAVLGRPTATAFSWADLVMGALVRLHEAKKAVKAEEARHA